MRNTGTHRHPGLPQSLLDEISKNNTSGSHRVSGNGKHKRRKAARSEAKLEKKQRKNAFHAHPKRPVEEEHVESPPRKKIKTQDFEPSVPATNPTTRSLSPAKQKIKKAAKKEVSVADVAPPTRSYVEEEEQAYIDYLESQLGYGQKPKKSSGLGDGLDDLFDFTSSLSFSQPKRRQKPPPSPPSLSSASEMDEDLDESEEDSDEDASEYANEEDAEWDGIQEDVVDPENESDAPDTGESSEPPAAAEPSSRYVPPHLRAAASSASDGLQRLAKQLKGLLNRMSEQNLSSIVDSIEEIYRTHRRHDVTSTLTNLILEGTTSHSTLLDSFVAIHAALVSALQKAIGMEFAAQFVHELTKAYLKYRQEAAEQPDDSTEAGGKESSNLIVLLAELYNFQVVSCVLMFDVIKKLLEGTLTETNVELLLKVVRSSGQQLRHDDPSALKDIVQIVQGKVSSQSDKEKLSSRTLFMVETLNNLKNNKIKKVATQNQSGDIVERLKKYLSSLNKRSGGSNEPLRVSLEDLQSADTKGKWWLVGAAWAGDPLVDRKQDAAQQQKQQTQTPVKPQEDALIKLARKQGMNTQVRQSIFVVLMSSEDYVDACGRLSQLNLSEVQQRDIIRVLVHCSGNEKAYNPYYTLICQHLCGSSHSNRITLQYCLWDFLRDLGESKIGGLEVIKNTDEDAISDGRKISPQKRQNLAKAFGWWFAKESVALTALKPVDFTVLKPGTKTFMKNMFVQFFASSQVSSPMKAANPANVGEKWKTEAVRDVFRKVARIEGLALGLIYFLTELTKETAGSEAIADRLLHWGAEAASESLRPDAESF